MYINSLKHRRGFQFSLSFHTYSSLRNSYAAVAKDKFFCIPNLKT